MLVLCFHTYYIYKELTQLFWKENLGRNLKNIRAGELVFKQRTVDLLNETNVEEKMMKEGKYMRE